MKSGLFLVFLSVCPAIAVENTVQSTNTVWEVRPTNGDLTFGGCFNSKSTGTDYTQQNTAQLTLTDLATSSAGAVKLWSVTGGFTAAMTGNCIRINSGGGFTTGFYMISTFVDGTTVYLSSSPSPYSAAANGAGKVGGAQLSICQQTGLTISSTIINGHFIYVKNEAWNEPVIMTNSGANGLQITFEGYNLARGDKPTGANRPTLDRNNAAGIAWNQGGLNDYFYKYLRIRRTGSTGMSGVGDRSLLLGCRLDANGGVSIQNQAAEDINIFNSQIDLGTNDGVAATGVSTLILDNSEINNNSGIGVTLAQEFIGHHNLIYANSSHGVSKSAAAQSVVFSFNTVDGNTGAGTDGFSCLFTMITSELMNNFFTNNGDRGVQITNGRMVFLDYNNFFGNTTEPTFGVPNVEANNLFLNPVYANAAGGDFTVTNNAVRATGYPGIFPSGVSVGYPDIGAVQGRNPSVLMIDSTLYDTVIR